MTTSEFVNTLVTDPEKWLNECHSGYKELKKDQERLNGCLMIDAVVSAVAIVAFKVLAGIFVGLAAGWLTCTLLFAYQCWSCKPGFAKQGVNAVKDRL